MSDLAARTGFIERLRQVGVQAVVHYVPLHGAPFCHKAARAHGDMARTEALSDRLVRLPLWLGLEPQQHELIHAVLSALAANAGGPDSRAT